MLTARLLGLVAGRAGDPQGETPEAVAVRSVVGLLQLQCAFAGAEPPRLTRS